MSHVEFPADFYGAHRVPFQQHVRMGFSRSAPDGPAVVSLAPRPELIGPDGEHSPAAVYGVAEVAAAVCASDSVWQHDPEGLTDERPVLLTTRVRFRLGEPGCGEIRAYAAFDGDGAEILRRLRKRRKVRFTIDVRVLGDDDRFVGEAEVDIYLREMDEGRLRAIAPAAVAAR